jgi:hypothetical protein
LSPKLAKSILRASARDVTTGTSNNGQPAGPGHDGCDRGGIGARDRRVRTRALGADSLDPRAASASLTRMASGKARRTCVALVMILRQHRRAPST